MGRKSVIENIIIGTLLESTPEKNYFVECRNLLKADMFDDDTNRRIYKLIAEMNDEGKLPTDPLGIFDYYGEDVANIVPRMCELCTEYSITFKKWEYNESKWINSMMDGNRPKYTNVGLGSYVNQLIKMAIR